MKAETIPQEFPDAEISVELEQVIRDNPSKEIDLIDAVIFDYEMGIFCYHVIWPAKKQELVYRTLKSSPFIVARYMKVAGEIYGRGPLVTAIADIKTLNKTVELVLKNASLAISGVYTAADDGIINPQNIQIAPGAIIGVARNGGPQGASLAPLPRAGDFNVSQIITNDLRMNIKKILMDDTLPPDNMSARSATEIAERSRELATNLGSAFGRLINETMMPVVSRILYIMDQQGFIDLPLKVNGVEVKITPVAPLAQTQRLAEVNEVVQFMQIAGSLGPEGQQSLSIPRITRFLAEKMNIDQDLLATPEEQQQMMEAAQEQMMAEQQAQMANDGGATMEAMQ